MAEKVQVGYRADASVYEELKSIAETEKRSISQIIKYMLTEQIKRYQTGGFASIFAEQQEQ